MAPPQGQTVRVVGTECNTFSNADVTDKTKTADHSVKDSHGDINSAHNGNNGSTPCRAKKSLTEQAWSTTPTCGLGDEGAVALEKCHVVQHKDDIKHLATDDCFAIQRWMEQDVQEDPWWRIEQGGKAANARM